MITSVCKARLTLYETELVIQVTEKFLLSELTDVRITEANVRENLFVGTNKSVRNKRVSGERGSPVHENHINNCFLLI